ncbi:ABC transporter permease [Tumidithrix elongata]
MTAPLHPYQNQSQNQLQNRFLTRFLKSRAGAIGLLLTISLLLVAILFPFIHPYDPAIDRDYLARLAAPSLKHPFGTDGLGRDILVLVLYGIRTSLLIGTVAVSLGCAIGTLVGLLAGYVQGWLDLAIGWVTDILLAFPSILLAIAIVTVTSPNLQTVIIAVGIVQIPIYIRLARGMVLSLKPQQFVLASQSLGASSMRLLFRHIFPMSLPPLVVQATLSIGTATLEAAGLGFLGLGVQPPTPELGMMLADAFKGGYSLSAPWTMLFPGLLITITVLAFNLLGDGLRDSLDPRSDT